MAADVPEDGPEPELIAYRVLEPRMPLVPAPGARGWMPHTQDGSALRCLPLLLAN